MGGLTQQNLTLEAKLKAIGQSKAPKCKDVEGYLTNGLYDVPKDYTGVAKECYENGQLNEKRCYVLGVLNGESLWYHENGHLAGKAYYANGIANGELKVYNNDGTWNLTRTYLNGEPIKCIGECDEGYEYD